MEELLLKIGNLAKDSFMLIFVRCVTLLCSIAQTMILARVLTKYDYGTYSEGMLLISIATTFAGFGANSAVNYFFNKYKDVSEKKAYVNTIFSLEFLIGIFCTILIFFLREPIGDYFHNPALPPIVLALALRPFFANIILMYQTLFISSRMTVAVAVRNLVVSVCQVAIVAFLSAISSSLFFLFLLLSLLDLLQIFVFSFYFRKHVFAIRPDQPVLKLIRPILSYSVPIAISLLLGTLLVNLDNLVIGKLMSTESLALYANMSKELPFAFIVDIFTTVMTPAIIQALNSGAREKFILIWSNYIQLGYMATWSLCFGAVACAPELVKFLYSEKYLNGLSVFIVYILVEMFRFTYFGMILTAMGRTKTILLYSSLSLLLNFFLNIALFYLMGMVGCAIATLVSIAVINFSMLIHSSKLLNLSLIKVLNFKKMTLFLLEMIVLTVMCIFIKQVLYRFISHYTIILFLIYALFLSLCFLINRKPLKKIVSEMDF